MSEQPEATSKPTFLTDLLALMARMPPDFKPSLSPIKRGDVVVGPVSEDVLRMLHARRTYGDTIKRTLDEHVHDGSESCLLHMAKAMSLANRGDAIQAIIDASVIQELDINLRADERVRLRSGVDDRVVAVKVKKVASPFPNSSDEIADLIAAFGGNGMLVIETVSETVSVTSRESGGASGSKRSSGVSGFLRRLFG